MADFILQPLKILFPESLLGGESIVKGFLQKLRRIKPGRFLQNLPIE